VAEVAYAVGFKSVAHFSNAFNEQTGVRPSAWREHSATKAADAEQ
jgi:transcriptional regulator GlxA family with amidase domain